MLILIEATEALRGSDRYIKSIKYKEKVYTPTASYPIGISIIDDKGYLTFMCMFGKRRLNVHCQETKNGYQYFINKK